MKHNDAQTTVLELKNAVKKFREDREWGQFHTPQNLAMDICVEASELLELFLWKDTQTVKQMLNDNAEFKQNLKDELGDILQSCLGFADTLGFDVSTILLEKLEKTALKYPIEEIKGKASKR